MFLPFIVSYPFKFLKWDLYSPLQWCTHSFSILTYIWLPPSLLEGTAYSILNRLTPWHSELINVDHFTILSKMFVFVLITRIMHMSLKASDHYKICIMGLDLLHKTWVQKMRQHLVFLNKLNLATSPQWVKMQSVLVFTPKPSVSRLGH